MTGKGRRIGAFGPSTPGRADLLIGRCCGLSLNEQPCVDRRSPDRPQDEALDVVVFVVVIVVVIGNFRIWDFGFPATGGCVALNSRAFLLWARSLYLRVQAGALTLGLLQASLCGPPVTGLTARAGC